MIFCLICICEIYDGFFFIFGIYFVFICVVFENFFFLYIMYMNKWMILLLKVYNDGIELL